MIELWGATSQQNMSQIQKLQNRAVRSVLNLPYSTPRTEMFGLEEANFLPVKGMYEAAISTYVFKSLKGMNQSEIEFLPAIHTYQSRYSTHLRRPHCCLELCKSRMSFAGPTIYNTLPTSIKNAGNLKQYRKLCYEHFKSNLTSYFD